MSRDAMARVVLAAAAALGLAAPAQAEPVAGPGGGATPGPTREAVAAPTAPAGETATPVAAETARQVGPVKVVVIPVVVGASAEPTSVLVEALARGLASQARWEVRLGKPGAPIEVHLPTALSADARAELVSRFESAKTDLEKGQMPEATAKLEALLGALEEGRRSGPIGEGGRALLARVGAALVHALASRQPQTPELAERAESVSQRVTLLLPGWTFSDGSGGSPVATAFLVAAGAAPKKFSEIEIGTRPEGCMVSIDGFSLGVAPVKLRAAPEATYYAEAHCPGAAVAGTTAGKATGSEAGAHSAPRKIVAGLAGESQRRILDLDFDRALVNDATGTRVRFASSADRQQLEESYARRAAELFDADSVVFVSLGELVGNEWLGARLYLRSGFRNRQGLARLEAPRATALGHYLASGRDSIGVLRAQEAGELVAASRAAPRPVGPAVLVAKPWYDDVTGWALTGAGVAAFAFGYHLDDRADEIQLDAALNSRNDPFRRQSLQSKAQSYRFWGGIGMFAGGLMAAMGALLLIVPDYGQNRSEMFVLAPSTDGRGAEVGYRGRF